MSRSVHERLRELETEVQNLEVLPAAAVRARGRSRGHRQSAALLAVGAVVLTAGAVSVTWPDQATTPVAGPGLDCVLTLPAGPAEVQVRVLDGGAPTGLREETANQLRARGFAVQDGPAAGHPDTATALRYGPAAIGAATLLRATLHGETALRFDPDRRDRTIDLTLGPAFTRLATTTEINHNLVAAGEPSAPPQCAAAIPAAPGR